LTGIGSADLVRHRAGIQLTAGKAIVAKCCDCEANYLTSKEDCKTPECPLYPWMPYGPKTRVKSKTKAEIAKKRFTKENKNEDRRV